MRLRITYVTLITLASYILIFNESCKQNVKPDNISVRPGYIKEDKYSAEKEIDEFHSRYNSEDFEAIYINSIQEFQKSQSKSDMTKVMKAEREEAGDFKSVIDKRINVIVGAPVQIRAVYISQYSKVVLTEMFVFVKNGDEFRLAWYKPSRGQTKLPPLENN